ncbi:MAG: hypothetical protein PHR18_02860 [Oscillospiraceae bacterium]|nr:hypothetical protein [Oscillospiraceae bacterium]
MLVIPVSNKKIDKTKCFTNTIFTQRRRLRSSRLLCLLCGRICAQNLPIRLLILISLIKIILSLRFIFRHARRRRRAGLTPADDNNAVWRKTDRKDVLIFT